MGTCFHCHMPIDAQGNCPYCLRAALYGGQNALANARPDPRDARIAELEACETEVRVLRKSWDEAREEIARLKAPMTKHEAQCHLDWRCGHKGPCVCNDCAMIWLAQRDQARAELAALKARFEQAAEMGSQASGAYDSWLAQLRAERDACVTALRDPMNHWHDPKETVAPDSCTACKCLARLPHAAERARLVDAVVAAARVPAVMDAIREASQRHDPNGSQFFATARALSDALAALDRHDQGGGGGENGTS